jgi:hypothetical protein
MQNTGPVHNAHLHLVHSLLGIPMQKRLPLKHSRELIRHPLEQLLDRSRVAQERNGHFQSSRRDVALSGQDVVRDPLDEVGRVLVLNVLHLLFDLFHGNFAAEDGGDLALAPFLGVFYG